MSTKVIVTGEGALDGRLARPPGVRDTRRSGDPARRGPQSRRGRGARDLPACDVSNRAANRTRGDERQGRGRHRRRAHPMRHPVRLHRARHPACHPGERARRAGTAPRRVDTGHSGPHPLACGRSGRAQVADRVCDRFDYPHRRGALGDRRRDIFQGRHGENRDRSSVASGRCLDIS